MPGIIGRIYEEMKFNRQHGFSSSLLEKFCAWQKVEFLSLLRDYFNIIFTIEIFIYETFFSNEFLKKKKFLYSPRSMFLACLTFLSSLFSLLKIPKICYWQETIAC